MNKKKKAKKKITTKAKKIKKSCREPSNKEKTSKVEKLIELAKKHPKPKKKTGFFSWFKK